MITKHFVSIARCSAAGVVSAVALLAVAVAPLIMNLDIKNPIIPLGVLGMFSILAAVLCRYVLVETKGKMTRENFGDGGNVITHVDLNRSPKIHRRARETNVYEDSGRESPDGASQQELLTTSEEVCKDIDDSLEVRFYSIFFFGFFIIIIWVINNVLITVFVIHF